VAVFVITDEGADVVVTIPAFFEVVVKVLFVEAEVVEKYSCG
jgi:hypothetical protein